MRDRLIKIVKDSLVKNIDYTCKLAENITDDLLANGVIVSPCKVGDILYFPIHHRVLLYDVVKIAVKNEGIKITCKNRLSESLMSIYANYVGKTIFLTEEEAERALKGGVEE